MKESTLIGLSIFIYLASWVSYLLYAAFRRKGPGIAGDVLAVCGLLVQTFAIGLRWWESYRLGIGHVPLSNLYESMVFFSWTMALTYLLVVRRLETRLPGAFVMPLVCFSLASTSAWIAFPAAILTLTAGSLILKVITKEERQFLISIWRKERSTQIDNQ